MSTRITLDDFEHALARHYYIYAGGPRPTSRLSIQNAHNRWADPKTADTIYLPDHRVAGKPKAVRELLIASHLCEEAIDHAMQNAYTANMDDTRKQRFDNELVSLTNYLKALDEFRQQLEREDNFGSDYDLERVQDQNPELFEKLTNNDDTITKALREAIEEGKVFLVDKEDMRPWTADAVVLLTDGSYVITHKR